MHKGANRYNKFWNIDRQNMLVKCVEEGKTASEISELMGVNAEVIIGQGKMLGLYVRRKTMKNNKKGVIKWLSF